MWLLAGILVLLIIAGLLIQTRPVKQKISHVLESQAVKVLNGKVKIGDIGGNFFTGLTLDDVLWTYQNDTFAFVKSLDASYNLLPLLNSELQVDKISINRPYIFLKQEKDSTWNFQTLVKENNSPQDTSTSAGNFRFALADLALNEGSLKIQALDTVIPEKVQNINLKASGDYSAAEQSVQVENFSLQTYRPDFKIVELSLNASRDQKTVSLKDFYLKTAQNALNAQASYSDNPSPDISAKVETEPVSLNEFEFFIPNLKIPAKPVVHLETQTVENGIEAKLSVSENDQKLDFDLFSENLLEFISNSQNTALKYRVTGNVENINLAHWLGNPELDHEINGKLEIDGEGTDPKTADINLDADLRDCIFAQKPVDRLEMKLHLNSGNLTGNIEGQGNFGYVSLTPNIKDIQGGPSYNVSALTRELNLAPLLGNDSLQSDINLQAEISGQSFDPEIIKAQADIIMSKSDFSGYTVDSLVGQFKYNRKNFEIDSLWARAQSLSLKASGNYDLAGSSDIQLSAAFDSIEAFSAYVPLDSVYGAGNLDAHLWGTRDSLFSEAHIVLEKFGFSGLSAQKLVVNGEGQLAPGDTTFTAQADVEKFRAGDFEVDSISATASYFPDSVSAKVRVAGDQLHTALNSQIVLADTLKIELSEWTLDYKNQHMELVQSPAIFVLDSLEYRLSNLKMASANTDSAQYIKAGGVVSRYGEEDFKLEIANVDIGGILESVGLNTDVSGKINTNATLKGSAAAPEITGDLSVDDALFYGYSFSELGGEFSLNNGRFNFDGKITPLDSGNFSLNANIPVTARFDSLSFGVDPKDTVSAELLINRFPLASVQFLRKGEEVTGFLDGKINVGGTFEEPKPTGNLSLNNASVIIPEYGIEYEDIIFDLNFTEDAARLDSFYIKTHDGDLKASGTIDFNSAFYKGDVNQSEITIHFDKFNPFDHRQFNMQLSGDASLKGKAGKVVFDGNLNVPEAEIYLPAVMSMLGRITAPDIPQPILVREIENLSDSVDTVAVALDTVTTRDTINLKYLDGLTGRATVDFPQNTWIKNKDMFVEISGELEVIKNTEFFELFGSIDVVRGQYNILGKPFKIDRGTITFQGGEDLMPRLNIQATYTFRNPERAEQALSLNVTGTANEPEINFTLDGSHVSEGDALSYILFGKAMNELTIDQQDNVSGVGQIAGSAAMSVLSSQLTNLLGNTLNVDYIEVKGSGDFNNATVVVGKYITNDLFVSYQQRFGETNQKDIAKYEVKLEYEIFKFLFLQLNNSSTDSGFDVVFKLLSK